jgi:hypothetical protein
VKEIYILFLRIKNNRSVVGFLVPMLVKCMHSLWSGAFFSLENFIQSCKATAQVCVYEKSP